ncbi:uncharacterized protein EV154DRAFT_532890 [Mucor mucedo]|uniref:uncharacterized protein n=1 Tax=Mucor mucedo TaxID=29922 RepID=UPI00221E9A02|nr:uncharacterized protein EV154DRAFT_532890 [Mucor mucedo]KAI7865982.1 hypothetical protein EV154DRAFT_532890 [Mucor mucedo]
MLICCTCMFQVFFFFFFFYILFASSISISTRQVWLHILFSLTWLSPWLYEVLNFYFSIIEHI